MTTDELMARIGEHVSVRRVFGEPIERDGVTVVPVAVVAGGGGGGQGPEGTGEGSGFGVWSRGIGVYAISNGRVRFVPAFDAVALTALALALSGRLLKAGRRRHRK
jgi:uncharacterized spore protein YtfJ